MVCRFRATCDVYFQLEKQLLSCNWGKKSITTVSVVVVVVVFGFKNQYISNVTSGDEENLSDTFSVFVLLLCIIIFLLQRCSAPDWFMPSHLFSFLKVNLLLQDLRLKLVWSIILPLHISSWVQAECIHLESDYADNSKMSENWWIMEHNWIIKALTSNIDVRSVGTLRLHHFSFVIFQQCPNGKINKKYSGMHP